VMILPGPPMSSPPSETDASPVPPRATASCPTQPGMKVCVSLSEVILRVIFVSEDVANVCVAPVCHEPDTPRAVIPVPPSPPASSPQPKCPSAQITLAEELEQLVVNPAPVKFPLIFIFVVEAFVENRFVELAVVEKRLVVVALVRFAATAKRFVDDAVVEKMFVLVALFMMSELRLATAANRFVDEAVVEKRFVVVALPRSESPVPFTLAATLATWAKGAEAILCLGERVSKLVPLVETSTCRKTFGFEKL
jgi:hypothetical protein